MKLRPILFAAVLAGAFNSAEAQETTQEPEAAPSASGPEAKIKNRVAEFSGLDKITGRTISFDVYVDETVQFGTLQVTPRICFSRPASQAPKTSAFLEVDEITLDKNIRRIFTGWMFANSPASTPSSTRFMMSG